MPELECSIAYLRAMVHELGLQLHSLPEPTTNGKPVVVQFQTCRPCKAVYPALGQIGHCQTSVIVLGMAYMAADTL